MLKRLFLIHLIIFSFIRGSYAQDLFQTFLFAKKQYEAGDYKAATLSLERVLFFDKGDQIPETYSLLAESYFFLDDYELAGRYYDLAYHRYYVSDSLMNEMIFGKINCLLLQKKFDLAHLELFYIDEPKGSYFRNKLDFYLGTTYFWLNNFEASKQHFAKLISTEDQELIERMDALFLKNKKIEKINPKKAKILSICFPGLGQLYYGEVKDGLNSLLLTGGLFVSLYYYVLNFSVIEGAVVVAPWLERYYKGGFRNAETLIAKRKEMKHGMLYHQILDVLEDNDNKEIEGEGGQGLPYIMQK